MEKKSILIMIVLLFSLIGKAQTINVDDVPIANDKTGTICVNLNGGGGYVATGFYVELPDGFSFTGNAQDMADAHVVKTYLQKDATTKVAAFSTDNAEFNNSSKLLNLQIKAEHTTAGTYRGKISGIEFASNKLELLNKSNVYFNIIIDESLSVNATNIDATESNIYNISGQQILQPENEVYIQEGKKYLDK